jgi:hypothetical protein
MGKVLAAVLMLGLPPAGQVAKPAPGTPVQVRVVTIEPEPVVSILLKERHGHVTPVRSGGTYTGGGNIDVAQPSPDTVVVTLTGGAVATEHPCGSAATLTFELEQCFEVVLEKPEVKAARLTVEGRVAGLLRGGRTGSAEESGGCATVTCGSAGLVTVCVPDHGVAGGECLAISDTTGPEVVPVGSGPHTLHVRWRLSASNPKALLGKAASAEFAPEPALDPLWVGGPRDPFHGVGKKDFGFQMVFKVAEETPGATGGGGTRGEERK